MNSSGQAHPRRTDNTDFKNLRPGQYARHPGRSSEKQAMASGHGVPLLPGSRGTRLGRPEHPQGFQGRDVRVAAAALANERKGR